MSWPADLYHFLSVYGASVLAGWGMIYLASLVERRRRERHAEKQ
jgi:hypothetical protein